MQSDQPQTAAGREPYRGDYSKVPEQIVAAYMTFMGAVLRRAYKSRAPINIARAVADRHMLTGRTEFTFDELAQAGRCSTDTARRNVRRLVRDGLLKMEHSASGRPVLEPIFPPARERPQ